MDLLLDAGRSFDMDESVEAFSVRIKAPYDALEKSLFDAPHFSSFSIRSSGSNGLDRKSSIPAFSRHCISGKRHDRHARKLAAKGSDAP